VYYTRLFNGRERMTDDKGGFDEAINRIARSNEAGEIPPPWAVKLLASDPPGRRARGRPPLPLLVHMIRALAVQACERYEAGARSARARALLMQVPEKLFCGLKDDVVEAAREDAFRDSFTLSAHPRSCKLHRHAGLRTILFYFLPRLVKSIEKTAARL
jgi:hypothetical protein